MRWSSHTRPPYSQNGGGEAQTRPWVAATIVVHQEGCTKVFDRNYTWPLCSCKPDIVGRYVTITGDDEIVLHTE